MAALVALMLISAIAVSVTTGALLGLFVSDLVEAFKRHD